MYYTYNTMFTESIISIPNVLNLLQYLYFLLVSVDWSLISFISLFNLPILKHCSIDIKHLSFLILSSKFNCSLLYNNVGSFFTPTSMDVRTYILIIKITFFTDISVKKVHINLILYLIFIYIKY